LYLQVIRKHLRGLLVGSPGWNWGWFKALVWRAEWLAAIIMGVDPKKRSRGMAPLGTSGTGGSGRAALGKTDTTGVPSARPVARATVVEFIFLAVRPDARVFAIFKTWPTRRLREAAR